MLQVTTILIWLAAGKLGMVYPDCNVAMGMEAAQPAPPEAVHVAAIVHDKPVAIWSLMTEPEAFDGPAFATVKV